MDGVIYEEDLLDINYEEYDYDFKDKIFFTAKSKKTMLENFKTDIVYYSGMNPWTSVENNTFMFEGEGTVIYSLIGVLLFITIY